VTGALESAAWDIVGRERDTKSNGLSATPATISVNNAILSSDNVYLGGGGKGG